MKLLRSIVFLLISIGFSSNVYCQDVPPYVPQNGLVGWWPFNGNANDESGNGNNGSVSGANLTLDRFSNSNSAYSFNGTTNYIEVAHSDSQNFPAGQSVSFWIYRTGTIPVGTDHHNILSKGAQLFNGQNIWTSYADNTINYHYIDGNYFTANNCTTPQNSISSNNWSHYVVTNDLTSINLYLNGNLVQTCSISNPSTTLAGTAQGAMNFGKGRGHFANEQGFQGIIDDIGIWNRALTPQEVANLFNGCQLLINTQPEHLTITINNDAQFFVGSPDPVDTYQWQTDLGFGFEDLNIQGQYTGVTTDTLTVTGVTMSNDNQIFRCIVSTGQCSDTSNVAVLTVNNTVNINDFFHNERILVFPNPTEVDINVAVDPKFVGKVYSFFDITGSFVSSGILHSAHSIIPMSNFPSGIYLLSIEGNGNAIIKVKKE